MRSRVSRGAAAAAWALAVGLAQGAPVQAQATTEKIVTVSPWTQVLDPSDPTTPEFACLPEPIFLAGEIRSQVTKTTDATGRVHYTHHLVPSHVEGFGPSGAGWARLSLAVADDVLDEGIERLAPALAAAYA